MLCGEGGGGTNRRRLSRDSVGVRNVRVKHENAALAGGHREKPVRGNVF